MRVSLISAIAVCGLVALALAFRSEPARASTAPIPVLVELFTSEGCSSCPPADLYLQALDRQPIPGAEIIVLSEHVDYWNQIGWKDPYSAHFYSERQSAYARRFGIDSVYTPQMVVDGAKEFVGSDSGQAEKAFAIVLKGTTIPVRISSISLGSANTIDAHLETGALPSSLGSREVDVYIALALSHAESQVSAGENAGHRLTHVAVARSLTKVGVLKDGQKFEQDVHLKFAPGSDPRNLRLITFLQQPGQGRVLGAASLPVSRK